MIFGLSTAHAAATLAIIMVGYQNKILDINVVNGTILLILITCMVASFVTENAGKEMLMNLAEKGEDEVLESKLRNKHLVVAMDKLAGNEKVLEFALQVSDPKVINPISVVSVLPNSRQAQQVIHKSRKNLEEIVKHFSGYETKLNTIATVDLNVSSGISRVAVELVADVVIVNDSNRPNFLKMIVGDDRQHLLESCDKTIFFCQIDKPSVEYQRLMVVAPEYAELENYFISWAERVLRYSNELKLELNAFMTENGFERLMRVGEANNITTASRWYELNQKEDFFHLAAIDSNDLIVVISSRPGSISHTVDQEAFGVKILKAYENNDWVLVYPGQDADVSYRNYEDVSGAPIGVGVDTLAKIGKEVGSIFKKES